MRFPTKAILVGGFVDGLLDLIFAVSFAESRGVSALKVFQMICSGLFGKTAYDGGRTTALYGIMLHFLMSIGWAVVFLVIFGTIRKLN